MGTSYRAIHLRTGETGGSRSVDEWLARHGLVATTFNNPYDACAHLLTASDQETPDLAFVGLDWLADDERGISDLIQQTWPAAVLIEYGAADDEFSASEENSASERSPVVRCTGLEALRRVLADSPAALLAVHAAFDASPSRESAEPPPEDNDSPVEAAPQAAGLLEIDRLTPDELATLLGDEGT